MKQLSEELYDELCSTLTDFETAPTDYTEDGWLSDEEWLDVFYHLCVKLQKRIRRNI